MRIRTLDQAWYEARENSKRGVAEISLTTGMPESTFYRKTSPTDPDVRVKDNEIPVLCNAMRQYQPMHSLAAACGGVFVRLPRGRAHSAPGLPEYQRQFGDMVADLLDFQKDPTEEKAKCVIEKIQTHLTETVSFRNAIKHHTDQLPLELGEVA